MTATPPKSSAKVLCHLPFVLRAEWLLEADATADDPATTNTSRSAPEPTDDVADETGSDDNAAPTLPTRATEQPAASALPTTPQAADSGTANDPDQCALPAPYPGPTPPTVHEGDFLVNDAATVEEAATFAEITGDLVITYSGNVELLALTRVGGNVTVDSTLIAELSLPALETIGGELFVYLNLELERLDLRSLVSVGKRVFIHRDLDLTVLHLGRLTEVGGELLLTDLLNLPRCILTVVHTNVDQPIDVEPMPGVVGCECESNCGTITTLCPE